jgi:hypothetical protein
MTHSTLTNQIRLSAQHSSRQNAKIDTLQIHHTASASGRGDAIVDMMVKQTRVVSSNYVIGNDGYLWCVVDEDLRAWTSGSTQDNGKGAAWDRRSITVEIVNQAGAPSWPISAKAINTAARLLMDLRKRYKIRTVIGHRDLWTRHRASYPTFCPGPNTVAAILAREAKLTSKSSTPKPDPQQTRSSTMRVIYNTDQPKDDIRRALVGELSFQIITGPESLRERKIWGPVVNVTVGEWNATRLLVEKRRAELDATSPPASATKTAADLADELANELAQRLKE